MQRILLVEDERTAREGVRDFLSSRGYSVTEAADGEEAVKKFCDFLLNFLKKYKKIAF